MDNWVRMPRIQQLPQHVVNQIAAGEVIERPASVVKELVENSLDAGASRIDVALEQGGMDLIRVVDNGQGIPVDELPLAVASHATSKLTSTDELFRIRSMGFRGEALASMGAVSRLLLRSRTPGSTSCGQIEVSGGAASAVEPCGGPEGTCVEVRQLFFNTPVRRKFLRSKQTELSHVTEALTRLALAFPERHFTLRHNDRVLLDLSPTHDWVTRITELFGDDLAKGLVPVESVDESVRLWGFAASPSHSRPNNKAQYLFLNRRYIRDRSLQHALQEAYRGLLLTGRQPIAFMRFEMPPDLVDVNVHPCKLEVRFLDGGRIYSQLLGTLRSRFLMTDLTHHFQASAANVAAADMAQGSAAERNSGESNALATAEVMQFLQRDFGGPTASWNPTSPQTSAGAGLFATAARPLPASSSQNGPLLGGHSQSGPLSLHYIEPVTPLPQSAMPESRRATVEAAADPRPQPAPQPDRDFASPQVDPPASSAELPTHDFKTIGPVRALQIHDCYLIAEDHQGLLVIDQHALHERILYEQIRTRVLAGLLEVQQLVVPEPIDLSAAEALAAEEHGEMLASLGFLIDPFGGNTVIARGYPAMLPAHKAQEVLRELLGQLTSPGEAPDRRDVLDRLLHRMACKAAVKAGDRLSPEEISQLLSQRHVAQDHHHCPHGRPTALILTKADLDKQFLRT